MTHKRKTEKGWIHTSGKVELWVVDHRGSGLHHIQFFLKNPSKFGVTEEEILSVASQKEIDMLIAGKDLFTLTDQPDAGPAKKRLMLLMMKKGWCNVFIDGCGVHSSIRGHTIQDVHKVAKIIDKERSGWTEGIELLEIELWSGENETGVKKFDNKYDINTWIKSSSPEYENIGERRTDTGKTMARFR